MTSPAATLNDAQSTSREATITRLAYSCLLVVGINSGWLGPFLPEISRTAHLPIERAGLIVSASASGYFISLLIAGEINQSMSAQKILVGAMVLFTAGLAWLGVAPGLAGLLGAGFLIGLANGGVDIGANALIVELNRERLASALNYLHVLFGVGAVRTSSAGVAPNRNAIVAHANAPPPNTHQYGRRVANAALTISGPRSAPTPNRTCR